MTADYWMNSQFSIARHTGSIKINGAEYIVVSSDLLRFDWFPVYNTLGRERTIGLINNGTSLDVAKEMAKQVKAMKDNHPKLF